MVCRCQTVPSLWSLRKLRTKKKSTRRNLKPSWRWYSYTKKKKNWRLVCNWRLSDPMPSGPQAVSHRSTELGTHWKITRGRGLPRHVFPWNIITVWSVWFMCFCIHTDCNSCSVSVLCEWMNAKNERLKWVIAVSQRTDSKTSDLLQNL